jgi:acetyl-CoA/propionyl-CoA carboxylase biotin carboxyl carrier protein
LAKLIVTGKTRDDALERSRRALAEFEVAGLPTVLPFHRAIVDDPAFAPADGAPFTVYTRWIETEFNNQLEPWSGSLAERHTEPTTRHTVVVEVGGKRLEVSLPSTLVANSAAHGPAAITAPPKRHSTSSVIAAASGDAVKSPMQATVIKVAVAEGDTVVMGDLVVVLEAMKMEQPLAAHKDGVVTGVSAVVGETVASGHVLLSITG